MTPAPPRRTIPVSEICERLGVGEMRVYELLAAGEIPALRPHRR